MSAPDGKWHFSRVRRVPWASRWHGVYIDHAKHDFSHCRRPMILEVWSLAIGFAAFVLTRELPVKVGK